MQTGFNPSFTQTETVAHAHLRVHAPLATRVEFLVQQLEGLALQALQRQRLQLWKKDFKSHFDDVTAPEAKEDAAIALAILYLDVIEKELDTNYSSHADELARLYAEVKDLLVPLLEGEDPEKFIEECSGYDDEEAVKQQTEQAAKKVMQAQCQALCTEADAFSDDQLAAAMKHQQRLRETTQRQQEEATAAQAAVGALSLRFLGANAALQENQRNAAALGQKADAAITQHRQVLTNAEKTLKEMQEN